MAFVATRLSIPDVIVLQSGRFADARGYFAETFRHSVLEELGIVAAFVQDNQAMSRSPATVRGLHFQIGASAQAKLVRVISGSVFDVAVDLRHGSPTRGRWVAATLTAEGGEQLFVPRGFAHGYCTLEPATVVAYKCDNYYDAAAESGIHHADPALAIDWPLAGLSPVVSDRDAGLPFLADLAAPPVFGPPR